MVRGFKRLQAQEKGFRTESLQTFRIALGRRYPTQELKAQYYERAQRNLATIPGGQSVASSTIRLWRAWTRTPPAGAD